MADSNFPRLTLTPSEARDWIRALHEFICLHKELCDAHTVDFLTKEHWKNVVRDDWKDDLLQMEDTECLVNPPVNGMKGSLQEFLYTASRLRLPMQPVETSNPLLFGMTLKKSHEVSRVSEFITKITASSGVEQILDVGSGKGYLSQHLSLRHGLTVVGMDSQGSNTDGALKRNRKVRKAYKSGSKERTHRTDSGVAQASKNIPSVSPTAWDLEEDWALDSLFDHGLAEDVEIKTTESRTGDILPCEQMVKHQLQCRSPPEVAECIAQRGESRLGPRQSHTPSYFPVTKEIGVLEGRDILHEAEKESSAAFVASQPCCLVGLHTCGDLAASCLRLFVQCQPIHLTCVVGCCYHLISENFEDEGSVSGFPLSSYLKSLSSRLGRTARMLACQNLQRIAEVTRGDSLKVGMFRAVFQVLLTRKLSMSKDVSSTQFMVGKQRRVPQSFEGYVRVASTKLGLDFSDLTDDQLRSLYSEHADDIHKLEKFFQLRVVIAPCVESLIILDRLLYVMEQDTTKDAYLVQLFDPFTSPRCFAIVAQSEVREK